MSTDRVVDKDVVPTHHEQNNAIYTTWMKLEIVILNEVNQTEKDK